MPKPAIFLDRNGTIIEDRDYLANPAGTRRWSKADSGTHRIWSGIGA